MGFITKQCGWTQNIRIYWSELMINQDNIGGRLYRLSKVFLDRPFFKDNIEYKDFQLSKGIILKIVKDLEEIVKELSEKS